MKKILFVSLLVSAGFFVTVKQTNAQQNISAANEMCWWYEKPATKYWEGLPIATGRFAAMVLGKTENEEIWLNDETLWSGSPYNPNNPDGLELLKQMRELIFKGDYRAADSISTEFNSRPMRVQHFQPMANLNLLFEGHNEENIQGYMRKLSMDSATVTITYKKDGVNFKREIFASYPDQVIVMRVSADKPKSINLSGWMSSLQPTAIATIEKGDLVMRGGTKELTEETYAARLIPGKMKWQTRVKILNEGGKVMKTKDFVTGAQAIQITSANSVTFIIAGATNWVNWNDISADEKARCDKYIADASSKKFAILKQRHLDDYMPLFGSCKIDLGKSEISALNTTERMERMREGTEDPLFVSQYFQYGRYLMLAGARENTLAFNNHNIWLNNMEGRWQGRWTLNINIQECYWPVESTNLAKLNESLVYFTEQLAQAGARTAKEMYGCRGWVAHHGTDIWFNTAPTDGHPNATQWPMGGVWILQQLFDHYLYHPDKDYLKRIYPLMKGAAEFMLDFMVTDPKTGWMVTNPSSSPENWYLIDNQPKLALSMASAMDIQLTRNLFRDCIQACKILDMDPLLQKQMEDVLPKLPPHQIGKYGQLQEWFFDFDEEDPKHRHMSHLFAFYPDDDITIYKNPDLTRAVENVLKRKDDKYLGWSGAWKINLYARLLKPEPAYEVLKRMLVDVSIHPREEDSKITPSFEGNQAIQGVTAGIAEMLMQSHSGEISLLPALPKAWKTGSIKGLRGMGGYGIDIAWENGKLKESLILPEFSQKCRLRTTVPVKIYLGNVEVEQAAKCDGTFDFQVEAGARYRVVPQ